MKINIHVETDSIEEGRRMLRSLEALLNSGVAVVTQQGVQAEIPPGGLLATLANPAQPGENSPEPTAEAPKRGRKPKAEAAPTPAPEPTPEPAAAEEEPAAAPAEEAEDIQPEPPAEEAEQPVSEEDIRKALNKLAGLVGVPAAMAVLEQSGHKKVKDVPESKRASLALLLSNAITKAEADRKAKAA